ncbi:adenylyltransferase/cytidyltransferase family protein [Selenomonas sp. KH1T6]|uniref:adenylyltransferase/cytidyltransferase family protein n=1 Tax=Selenomonas sp. KH1T6 TaxID=3158784 RepID=UPI0008A762D3|nr:D-beta-D-heptose 7-phosphate kinase / D-beta-D-heptose 1-phosphate adenosyltransferase [Selenomonas ruminantium]
MIINYEDLKEIRARHQDKKIVMLKGTFDLFHLGHLNMIRRAKALGDILVVLVKCDEAIKLKGTDRPIVDEQQRAMIVDAIKYVDYTLIANRLIEAGVPDVQPEEKMQYLRYYQLVSDLRPDVLIKPGKKLPQILSSLYQRIGTAINEVEETPGVSTTILIGKIRSSGNGK